MPQTIKENSVAQADALSALERVLSSSPFANSIRLSEFLRYTVDQTLAGNADSLKEYAIATNAYGRKSDFDPSQDTIVRTEARRLRRKLKEYYEGEGRDDAVVIFYRSGSYVPVIHWRDAVERHSSPGNPGQASPSSSLWVDGDGVWMAVAPFSAEPGDAGASSFAYGLGEEILHRMTDVPGIRVVTALRFGKSGAEEQETSIHNGRRSVQIIIGGTVRREDDRFRVIVRVTTAAGLMLWSQRHDFETEQGTLVRMQEKIAAAVLSRVAPRETVVLRFAATPSETLYKLYSEVLAAEALLEESTLSALSKALKKFEVLKSKAPEYARLDCGIAQCCVGLAQRGGYPADGLVARAFDVAHDLIVRYPDLPEAHSIQGMVLAQAWRWEEAEANFKAALDLGNQHSLHRQYGVFLMALGRFHDAWEHLQAAQEIDPFSTRQKVSMGRFFYLSRWHKEARAYYQEISAYGDLPLEPSYFHALTLIQMREAEKALAIIERLNGGAGTGIPAYQARIAELYALCGEAQKAKSLVEQAAILGDSSQVTSFGKAGLLLSLGDHSKAIQFVKESLERREPELPWLAVDPRFDSIRSDPAHAAVVHAIFHR